MATLVRSHHTVAGGGEDLDLVPRQVPKGGEAVEQDDERALPLIDIMQAYSIDLREAMIELPRIVNVGHACGH